MIAAEMIKRTENKGQVRLRRTHPLSLLIVATHAEIECRVTAQREPFPEGYMVLPRSCVNPNAAGAVASPGLTALRFCDGGAHRQEMPASDKALSPRAPDRACALKVSGTPGRIGILPRAVLRNQDSTESYRPDYQPSRIEEPFGRAPGRARPMPSYPRLPNV